MNVSGVNTVKACEPYHNARFMPAVPLLVCGVSFAKLDKEKFFGKRITASVGAQVLRAGMGTIAQIAGSKIDSDNSSSYTNLRGLVASHRPEVIPKEMVDKALPWVHIAISNAKRVLLDIFHDIQPEYLQNYLNEFCYKFNRRYFGDRLFERLLLASVNYKNEFRYHVR